MPPPTKGWRDSLNHLYRSHVKGGKSNPLACVHPFDSMPTPIVDARPTHSCRYLSAGFAVLPLPV
jgi:hypothetical protein